MANAPAIESVLTTLAAKLTAVAPSKLPGRPFRQAQSWVTGAREIPVTQMRQFHLAFGALRDLSNEGRGVQAVGLADREVKLDVEILYPRRAQDVDMDGILASDSELLARALGRSSSWAGTPIQRAVVALDKAEIPGPAYQLTAHLTVQYRDVE